MKRDISTKDEFVKGQSLWADAWRRIKINRVAMLCLWVILAFTVAAIYGEASYWRYNIHDVEGRGWMAPVKKTTIFLLRAESVKGTVAPYNKTNLDYQYFRPGVHKVVTSDGGVEKKLFLMGTDGLGRDVFLRILQGARIAFQVGIITSLIAIVIGVLLGSIAGYFGGWVDDVIVWLYSTFACMPTLLFIMAISMRIGKGLAGVYVGIGLSTWVGLCRLIRAEVMKHRERPYVKAARALGLGNIRILFRHILPNVMHLVIISFSLRFPAAIGTEVIMSYIGVGAVDEPSWGVMISSARLRLWYGMWWEMTFTTLAIFLMILSFNLFGDALRDALDPRLRKTIEV